MLRALSFLCALAPSVALAQAVPEAPRPTFDLAAAIAEGPPMTAERAAARALAASPSMEEARALSRAAEASVARARAAMLPRLELSATYQHIDGFPDGEIAIGGDPAALEAARMLAERVSDPAARTLWLGSLEQQGRGASIEIPRDRFGLSARLTWPVSDLFFAMMPALEAAEQSARARALSLEASQRGVVRSAREAFYQLARARGGLAVAQEAARQADALRAQIEAAVRAGLLTEADRLAADARVASAERAVATAEMGVAVADAALRAMLDAEDGPAHGVAEPLFVDDPSPPRPAAALASEAVARRPELEALRAQIRSRGAARAASAASGYPHLSVYAGADYANPNRYQIPPRAEFTPSWEVGAAVVWSPNDTLSAAHQGDALSAEIAALEAQEAQLARMVRLEVRQARARWMAARASIDAARTEREAAEAAYESRFAQLHAGHATSADLFAAEGQLNGARLAELDAAIQLHLARVQLEHATGE